MRPTLSKKEERKLFVLLLVFWGLAGAVLLYREGIEESGRTDRDHADIAKFNSI